MKAKSLIGLAIAFCLLVPSAVFSQCRTTSTAHFRGHGLRFSGLGGLSSLGLGYGSIGYAAAGACGLQAAALPADCGVASAAIPVPLSTGCACGAASAAAIPYAGVTGLETGIGQYGIGQLGIGQFGIGNRLGIRRLAHGQRGLVGRRLGGRGLGRGLLGRGIFGGLAGALLGLGTPVIPQEVIVNELVGPFSRGSFLGRGRFGVRRLRR